MVDRIRSEVTLEAGLALVKIQETHLAKTGLCNESFGEAIKMIDFKADSRLLVDNNKSTLLLPPDFVFVDLADIATTLSILRISLDYYNKVAKLRKVIPLNHYFLWPVLKASRSKKCCRVR